MPKLKKFLTDASRFLKNKRAPMPRTPYATAVIQVHTPQPEVTASKRIIPKKPKINEPKIPNFLENGIIVASIGSKFGGLKGIKRKRKTTIHPRINLSHPVVNSILICKIAMISQISLQYPRIRKMVSV